MKKSISITEKQMNIVDHVSYLQLFYLLYISMYSFEDNILLSIYLAHDNSFSRRKTYGHPHQITRAHSFSIQMYFKTLEKTLISMPSL